MHRNVMDSCKKRITKDMSEVECREQRSNSTVKMLIHKKLFYEWQGNFFQVKLGTVIMIEFELYNFA